MNPPSNPLAPDRRPLTAANFKWLLAALVLVIAPHVMRIGPWLTGATIAFYTWKALILLDRRPAPPRWLLAALALLALALVWLEYGVLFARNSGIAMLVLFSGLKLLEVRTHRDATIVAFLCYVLIVTNLLHTQSVLAALQMCAGVVIVTTTLIQFNAPRAGMATNLKAASLLLAHAVPLGLVLFVLFPRTQGPIWSLPQDTRSGTTGLSDSMSPGGISELALSDAIAFRAEFRGDPPPLQQRYWRGPVLWDYDGRTWTMGPTLPARFNPPSRGEAAYRYTVMLEPQDQNWLFALESASVLPPQSFYTMDGRIVGRNPARTRLRYDMESIINPVAEDRREPRDLRRALRLPEGYNPRARDLAARWRAEAVTDEEVLLRAVAYLRSEKLVYTLEPPLLGRDAVDDFLFHTRAGFCEHFSAAFVFLMRAAGVPARVVTGYQGGDVNPIDRIMTVRQSDAHAWAEVYLPDRGWIRVDPTAAAVPGRVDSGLARAVASVERAPFIMRTRYQWLRDLRYNWEAAMHQWNIWILGYNTERQRDLAERLGFREIDWRSLVTTLFAMLGFFATALVAWAVYRQRSSDPVQDAWLVFCDKFARDKLPRAPHEGPRDYAERAARHRPALRTAIESIASLYVSLRYGERARQTDIATLRHRVRSLRLT